MSAVCSPRASTGRTVIDTNGTFHGQKVAHLSAWSAQDLGLLIERRMSSEWSSALGLSAVVVEAFRPCCPLRRTGAAIRASRPARAHQRAAARSGMENGFSQELDLTHFP